MRLRPLFAVLVGAMLWHAPARAGESAETEARALFTQGNQHIQDGDFAGALALFQRAYTLFPNVKILLNIGTMQRQLGRNAEAADAYAAYLRDPGADPAKKAEVGALLATLEAQVGKLRVVVDGGAATVRVDGKVTGAPASEVVVHVEPGTHTVSAEREGGPRVQVDAQARAGSETAVPVRLSPPSAPPPSPLPPPPRPPLPLPAPPASVSPAHRVMAVTTTVIGAAGLIAGVPLALTARSQWNELRQHCKVPMSPPMGCLPADAHLQTSAGQLADGATAAFVIGGAAAVAATVLWITARTPPKAPSALRFTPVVGPGGAAGVVEGRF